MTGNTSPLSFVLQNVGHFCPVGNQPFFIYRTRVMFFCGHGLLLSYRTLVYRSGSFTVPCILVLTPLLLGTEPANDQTKIQFSTQYMDTLRKGKGQV